MAAIEKYDDVNMQMIMCMYQVGAAPGE